MPEEILKDPSDAGSMKEFKSNPRVNGILNGTAPPVSVKSDPAPVAEKQDAPPDGEKPDSEIAPASETGKPQGKKASDRFKELTDQRKAAESRAEKAERELEELRKGTRKPEESKPADKPVSTDALGPRPKFSDFEKDAKFATYAEAQDAYNEAVDEWRDKKTDLKQKETQAQSQQTEAQKSIKAKHDKAVEKYPDLDEVLKSAVAATEGIKNGGVEAALNESDMMYDLVYHFCNHLDEYRAIAAMSPQSAYRAVVKLEMKLSGEERPPEEKKPTLVSRAAPPPERAGGTASNLETSPAKAGSMADFKKNANIQKILNGR